jgi:hypothetical protein
VVPHSQSCKASHSIDFEGNGECSSRGRVGADNLAGELERPQAGVDFPAMSVVEKPVLLMVEV